jgi:hypothetical protein
MIFRPFIFFVLHACGTVFLTVLCTSPLLFHLDVDAFCCPSWSSISGPTEHVNSMFHTFPPPHTTSLTTTSRTVLYTSSSSSSSSAVSTNPNWLAGISLIDEYNDQIYDQINQIRQGSSYFRLFCVDILASCEYLPQELFECYSETCEVYPVDEEDVSQSLSIYNIRDV